MAKGKRIHFLDREWHTIAVKLWLIAAVFVASLVGLGAWRYEQDQQQEFVIQTLHEAELSTAADAQEAKQREIESRVRLISTLDGDAVADMYEMCTDHPPQTAAHQKQCSALTTKVDRQLQQRAVRLPKW